MVLEHDGDVVAGSQAFGVEQLGEALRPFVELGVGHGGPAVGHDHCRRIGTTGEVRSRFESAHRQPPVEIDF